MADVVPHPHESAPPLSPKSPFEVEVREVGPAPIVVGRGGHMRAPGGDVLGQIGQRHVGPVLAASLSRLPNVGLGRGTPAH
jgi:hypothetical protein